MCLSAGSAPWAIGTDLSQPQALTAALPSSQRTMLSDPACFIPPARPEALSFGMRSATQLLWETSWWTYQVQASYFKSYFKGIPIACKISVFSTVLSHYLTTFSWSISKSEPFACSEMFPEELTLSALVLPCLPTSPAQGQGKALSFITHGCRLLFCTEHGQDLSACSTGASGAAKPTCRPSEGQQVGSLRSGDSGPCPLLLGMGKWSGGDLPCSHCSRLQRHT